VHQVFRLASDNICGAQTKARALAEQIEENDHLVVPLIALEYAFESLEWSPSDAHASAGKQPCDPHLMQAGLGMLAALQFGHDLFWNRSQLCAEFYEPRHAARVGRGTEEA
jgi:hypothetical protein